MGQGEALVCIRLWAAELDTLPSQRLFGLFVYFVYRLFVSKHTFQPTPSASNLLLRKDSPVSWWSFSYGGVLSVPSLTIRE